MFSATSWVLKKWSFNFNIKCQVTLWTLIGCFRKFVMYYNTRRTRPKFFHWKDWVFLQKFMSSATSWVLKKWSYNFNINCQVTFWNLISCFLTFFMYYNTRRSRPKFFHWKHCLFLQKFMFSATSWVMKKWSYNFNVNCQVTLWNPYKLFPDVCLVLKYEKKQAKIFSSLESLPFSSKVYVFSNLLGPEEMIF